LNPPYHTRSDDNGQSLIEACLTVGLLSLIFFGLLQISQVFAAREILAHAAARGVRARTVGFNHWMVTKVIRVAAIPNAGRMLEPAWENINPWLRDLAATASPGTIWDAVLQAYPHSEQSALEQARIPEYLAAVNWPQGHALLNYESWDSIQWGESGTPAGIPGITTPEITIHAAQAFPLKMPLHRVFYAADSINLSASSGMENHYALYLDDQYW